MQWAPRLQPWRIAQLYNRTRLGILDEDKLLHIGWGLYARGEAVLAFGRAMRGQVPCPECDHIVHRQIFHRQKHRNQSSTSDFPCETFGEKISWNDCRNTLRNHPRYFDCGEKLEWNYTNNNLACHSCKNAWAWQTYRQSIKHRVKLPCPIATTPSANPAQNQLSQ